MFIAILIAVFLIAVLAIWITTHLVGLLITLLVAGFIGWLADRIVPGKIPYGIPGAIAFGLIGSWLGGHFIHFGPHLAGLALIPGLIGAMILALGVQLYGTVASTHLR
ncbi:MAG TPA: hypothetical protein VFI42_14255 [Thermomicrobiaceae bacterium]|nr:hypothetical protein [Thermomicrobiaceae bacterium]